MKSPLLSICIPTFNRKNELSRLLSSIIPQCVGRSVEIVVSDNASADETQIMCNEFAASYPWFNYQRNSNNIGYANNLISVLKAAQGKYLWMLGDDELVNEKAVVNIVSVLTKKKPNLLICNLARLSTQHDNWSLNADFNAAYDMHDLSLNELLTITGGWVSLISVNILLADRFYDWLNSHNSSNYTDYVGLEITLHSGALGKCSVLSETLVGRKKEPFLANRFDRIETYAIDFIRPLNYMVKNGKITSKVRNSIVRQMYFGMLGFKLIHMKMSGRELPPLKQWLSEHYRVPMFWVFTLPLLVMPRLLIRVVVITIRCIARPILSADSNIRRLLDALP